MRYRIVLDVMKSPSGQNTVIVDGSALLQNLEYYEKQGIKWIVVKA